MKKIFDFGKIEEEGKTFWLKGNVSLEYDNYQRPIFLVSIKVYDSTQSKVINYKHFKDLVDRFSDNQLYMQLYNLEKKYLGHFRHHGTPQQEQALEQAGLAKADMSKRSRYLTKIGLYEVEYQGVKRFYNHAYFYYPIEEKDLETIKKLLETKED